MKSNRRFKKPTKQCKECNNFISVSNYNKHTNICNGKPSLYIRRSNGLVNRRIKQVSDIDWSIVQEFYNNNHSYMEVCKEFNVSTGLVSSAIKKGLFKTRSKVETSRLKGHFKNRQKTPEHKEKIRQSMKRAVLEGRQKTPRPYGDRCKHFDHVSWLGNKEHLQSTWEKKVAEFLDEYKIVWSRCKKGFPYVWKDQTHQYFPDFFLEETNTYIEVKGWKKEQDLCKWRAFPQKLLIVDKDSINNLKCFFAENSIIIQS